jgi:ornithine carbamoyltransferase
MGQEEEADMRRRAFQGYQINRELLARAKNDAIVLHCLPAHYGEEITKSVVDSANSAIFEQAENRLHAQKALIVQLLGTA